MNPLRWAKAEVLHLAWKKGRWMPPDRRLLKDEILPELAKDAEVHRVLSVGVAWYTKDYEAAFAGKTFETLEIDPSRSEFGSSQKHVVGDVCELATLFADDGGELFDAILLNGVIGYGLDNPESVDRGLRACASRMRKGATLVIGINEEKPTHIDPSSVEASALFESRSFARWSAGRVMVPVPFRERTHTFLFWQKR